MNNKIIRLTQENGYSTYKNNNSELVKLIKEVPNDGTFVLNQKGLFKIDKTIDETQLLCTNEDGIFKVIKTDEVEELQSEGHLLKINKKYPVPNYFIDHFGEIEIGNAKILEVTDEFDKHQTGIYSGVHYRAHTWEFFKYGGVNATYKYDESNLGYKNAFIWFNEDGNYVVRDYNLKLTDTEFPVITREQNLANFLNSFDKYKVLEHVDGSKIWFTDTNKALNVWSNVDDEAYSLNIEVEEFPHSSGNRYFLPGESYRKITKPKIGLVEVGSDSIKRYLNNIIEKFFEKKEVNKFG
tara:strand:+ start:5384 stop:6271 length:888 start_codon:yes stop_codon:yes gene_type:complete